MRRRDWWVATGTNTTVMVRVTPVADRNGSSHDGGTGSRGQEATHQVRCQAPSTRT